jgi:predicted nucleotidyltransferase
MSDTILTWAERDRRRLAAHKASVAAVRAALAHFAKTNGGRFVLFGSVARGEDRPGSDVDVMVDFPEAIQRQAALFAEEACSGHGLRADVWPKVYVGDALMARIDHDGVVLK